MREPLIEHSFIKNLPPGFQIPGDAVGRRLLAEYGAIFVARGGVIPPPTVIFPDERAVSEFQSQLTTRVSEIGGTRVWLQAKAFDALQQAMLQARVCGRTITPRGADASGRSYKDTVELWRSRVEPGLEHWLANGRITRTQADRIRHLSPFDQVPAILELEADGIWFAKDLSKSILYSVAAPGTSQHLSLLAIDVNEHADPLVREILASNGWFQTVVSDLPHFTFLGVDESELPALGLRKAASGDREYWLPDLSADI